MPDMVKEGRGWMPRPAHEEGIRVSRLLARMIEDAGLSVRRVEEMIGWGQGTLAQVLAGDQPIRVSHLAAVAGAIGRPTSEIFRELAGEDDGESGGRKAPSARKRPPVKPSRDIVEGRVTEEDVLNSVRDLLRRYQEGKGGKGKKPKDK